MLNNPSYVIEALIVVALDTPTNFTADAGQGEVTLKWTDPVDKYATPEGETAQDPQQLVAKWSHTLVVRNTDHQPESPDDGTVILTSSVRNQYQTNGYVDNTVVNGTPYYYGVFAISTAGVPSAGAFASATPIAGTPLGELAEGTLIKIQENGAPVEFYVAKQNYEEGLNGSGRVLCVRKDCYDKQVWNSSGNEYSTGNMDTWLNNTYKHMLSNQVQDAIVTTAFYYTKSVASGGTGNVTTLRRSVFLLSSSELGKYNQWANNEGAVLPIASTLQIAHLNNNPTSQWTRSPYAASQSITYSWMLNSLGNLDRQDSAYADGARPCFTLPSTALVDQDLNLIETAVQTTALSAA